MGKFNIVGKSILRKDAIEKACGMTQFARDFNVPGMLYAVVLRSPFSSAEIVSLNMKKASKMRGVRAILTAKDIPGKNLYPSVFVADRPVLAEKRIKFKGEAVALIAADTLLQAEKAGEAIHVNYKELKGYYDSQDVLDAKDTLIGEGSDIVAEWHITKGDIHRGFEEAEVIVEETYKTQFVEHAPLEIESGVSWVDDNGVITIVTGTQHPELIRGLASILAIPQSKVRLIGKPFLGGAFGKRLVLTLEPYLALLAYKTGVPIKMSYTREESILSSSKRHPFTIKIRAGVKKDGTFTAFQSDILGDSGAYVYSSPLMSFITATHITGPYKIPNVDVKAKVVLTNNPYTSAMRGVGGPQANFACEMMMDKIARTLGMDPVEFRKKNFIKRGDQLGFGRVYDNDVRIEETLYQALNSLGERTKPKDETRVGRGVSCNMTCYGPPGRTVEAQLNLFKDGSAVLKIGSPDLGCGQQSMFAQIVSEILGIPIGKISVYTADTSLTPPALQTAASSTTYLSGNAVLAAAHRLRDNLIEAAIQMMPIQPIKKEEIIFADEEIYFSSADKSLSIQEVIARCEKLGFPIVAIETSSSSSTPMVNKDTGEVYGLDDYTFGTHAAEVEVDIRTGQVRVLKLGLSHDVGTAINPASVMGQIEGGAIMALGYCLMEDLIVERGNILTPSLAEYLIPTSKDVPPMETRIVESGTGLGPFGAKGIGEPPCNTTAAAIANAIFDAAGVQINELPITSEKVYFALQSNKCKKGGDIVR